MFAYKCSYTKDAFHKYSLYNRNPMTKDEVLRVRVTLRMREQLIKKHPTNYSKVIRGLIQMYLEKKIPRVEYSEVVSTESFT